MFSLCLPLASSRKSPCAACSLMLLCVVHGPCVCLGGCQQCQQCLLDNSPVAVTKPLSPSWTQGRSRAMHQHPFYPLHLKLLELHRSQPVFSVATGWLSPLILGTYHSFIHSLTHLHTSVGSILFARCWGRQCPCLPGLRQRAHEGQAGGRESYTGAQELSAVTLRVADTAPGPRSHEGGGASGLRGESSTWRPECDMK